MRTIAWPEYAEADFLNGKSIALSIGVFDGVHQGHRLLLERVLRAPGAEARGVVTFADNPKRILRPEGFKGEISSLAQRLEAFASLGLDFAVLIDFSGEFSTISGREFLARLALREGLRYVAIGENFHCGHRMDTDAPAFAAMAAERGIEVACIPPFTISGETVSSSRIRADIAAGRLQDAERLLGRPHSIDLRDGELSRDGGERVVRIAGIVQILPPDGIYRAAVREGGRRYGAELRLDRRAGTLRWGGMEAEGPAIAGMAALELVCDRIDIDKE